MVDVRTDLQFDDAHVPGAIAVTAQRVGFGTRLAWLAPPGPEVVFVGRDDEECRARPRAWPPRWGCAAAWATWPAA